METTTFHHTLGFALPSPTEGLIFSSNEYFSLFKNYELHQFSAKNPNTGKPLIFINVAVHAAWAIHPLLAPYGSIYTDPRISDMEIHDFLVFVQKKLKELAINGMYLVLYPEAINYNAYLRLEKILTNTGFLKQEKKPSWIFLLEEFTTENKTNPRGEFVWDEDFDLKEIHEILTKYRTLQGYEFQLSLDDFCQFFQSMPENHALLGWKNEGKWEILLPLTVVSGDLVYAFPAAYHPGEIQVEKVLHFYTTVFQFLKSQGIRFFDAGTTLVQGDKLVFNSLGAVKTYKNTFVWENQA